MGWWQQMRNYLNPPRNGKQSVNLEGIGDWLQRQRQEVISQQSFRQEAANYSNGLWEFYQSLKIKLDLWHQRTMGITDDDLRKEMRSTLTLVRKFIKLLELPDNWKGEQLLEIHNIISKEIKILIHQIQQSKLSHNYILLLVESEPRTNPVMNQLLALDALQDKFNHFLTAYGIQKLAAMNDKAKQIQSSTAKILQLRKLIKEKEDRLKLAEIKRKEKEDFITDLRENSHFKELQCQEEERKKLVLERNDLNDKIFIFFSKLKGPFKEYFKLHPEKRIVQRYITDPVAAFLEDEGLQINHICTHVDATLRQEKIIFPLEESTKILEHLEQIHVGYLENLQHRYSALQKRLEQINSSMKNKDFLLKVEEAKYRLEHFKNQVKRVQDEISACDEEILQTIELRKREIKLLQDAIRMGLGQQVEIIAS